MSQGNIEIPATSANLGPGYDVLGLALNITNVFEWEYSSQKKFKFEVNFSELVEGTIPNNVTIKEIEKNITEPTNHLFIKSYQTLFTHAKKKAIPLRVHIGLNVPISRGLGSSATVILAGLLIAQQILKKEYALTYSKEEIFKIAYEIEGHPDNIAAALWGGVVMNIPITANTREKGNKKPTIRPIKIDFCAPLKLIGIIPHYQISTDESRRVLPKQVPLHDVAFQSSRLATMVRLFQKANWTKLDGELLKICLSDKLHQPYRLKLLAGAEDTFWYWEQEYQQNFFGCYISGSGSTLLSFWPQDKKSNELDLTKVMREQNIESTQVEFIINQQGPCQTHI